MIYLLDPSIPTDIIFGTPLTDEDIKERIKQGAKWYCTDCKKSFISSKDDHKCDSDSLLKASIDKAFEHESSLYKKL